MCFAFNVYCTHVDVYGARRGLEMPGFLPAGDPYVSGLDLRIGCGASHPWLPVRQRLALRICGSKEAEWLWFLPPWDPREYKCDAGGRIGCLPSTACYEHVIVTS